MIIFFKCRTNLIIAVDTSLKFSKTSCRKMVWLFNKAELLSKKNIDGFLIGPRREMVTPWSTNAVEITRNMGIEGINRIEEFWIVPDKNAEYDPMIRRFYTGIGQDVFTVNKKPEPIVVIGDIPFYNQQEGLALNPEEIKYLNALSEKLGRKLTDSEVFGFSQVNSEHCRHKVFNGIFVIDGIEKEATLFDLIRKTSQVNPNRLVSAYKDNVAFNAGPVIEQFAPQSADKPDYFSVKNIETVLSLKAETHNFPTTVEPFNGASTGAGGEIRDRLGGGKASLPIAGTAVYMTSYPRTGDDREWENAMPPRKWIYQTPAQILIKASNGASDFGNKFGQPLICGSLLTFEHEENRKKFAYDKVIMLAGGIGFANKRDALKEEPVAGERVVLLGGDNYRIGMGGGAVSSVETGEYNSGIELNAVQRANPEMQKRVANVIRALAESDCNPIISIHDHGAGGHLNCLSELVESSGGKIMMANLPIGDPTLSAKEIIGNESQERMGLLLKEENVDRVCKIAERERAPMYVVGETTGDGRLVFEQADGQRPLDMQLSDFFGKPPRTVTNDMTVEEDFKPVCYDLTKIGEYLENVLQLESVACKDWLTNKVDRSITGKIAHQQCQGEIQLPLSDLGAVALDYRGKSGMAVSIGHAPQAGLINPAAGSILAVAEALTNLVFAPLKEKSASVSLSANWMWPGKNPGEDARLYEAVEACSDFACKLGINIPTGKDSLSMTQKYGDEKVFAPGTVVISAGAEVSDVRKIVSPVLTNTPRAAIFYIDFSSDTFKLGGSAFAQSLKRLGDEAPSVTDAGYFKTAFDTVQELVEREFIIAGHDISAGGMITTLLEMTFGNATGGLSINLDRLKETDLIKILFAENPGIVIQVRDRQTVEDILNAHGIRFFKIGKTTVERHISITKDKAQYCFDIDRLRDTWFTSSYLLDRLQSGETCAKQRFLNYKQQPLQTKFRTMFSGTLSEYGLSFNRRPASGVKAAILREQGTNGDREMAYALYLAGFDVKDVHTTDLISARETLEDVHMLVFCGGFANSDVLGSAKGWAGSLLFNEKAKKVLDDFYDRPDTLSLGVCNGCQLMMELNLVTPRYKIYRQMLHNDSHKFESAFVSVTIPKNKSVMLASLAGSKLGVWIAHGEGKFSLPMERKYQIVARYVYPDYPGNPNGSDDAIAGICSKDGRHLAMMPHPERAVFPWQCAYYPDKRKKEEITPWMEAFVNARKWIEAAAE